MYRNTFYSYLKSSSFTDGAWKQEGGSLHLKIRAFMTYGFPLTQKVEKKIFYNLFV